MHLPAKQIEAILNLPGPRRYDHFIKVVADRGSVWVLSSDRGLAMVATEEGLEAISLWPAEEYAQRLEDSLPQGNFPLEISLGDFLVNLASSADRAGKVFIVFPVSPGVGVIPDSNILVSDIRNELSRIE